VNDTHIFDKIHRPKRLPDEIARSISSAIEEGQLKPGDRLPTEHSLSQRFGVARTVVREAVSLLKHDGIINARQGVGVFVADVGERRVFRISTECFEKRMRLVQLLQLRTGVQADAAALAATARTSRQIKGIAKHLKDMATALDSGPGAAEFRVDAEAAFYRSIAEASGNDYYVEFVGMIESQVMENLRSVSIKNALAAEWDKNILQEHRAVFEGLNESDPDRARNATRYHFEQAAKRLSDRADFADI
jgi:GntR family transcriptional repressor for pyruvate dehydrogenase complex